MPNALIYRCKNGCSWLDLPGEFGNWHTIYVRFAQWAKNGVLERIQALLSEEGLPTDSSQALDSTLAKVHPDASGCLGKYERQAGIR
ncbi:MAG: transposase [Treponema sp.]|jgi:transposase|nr:transposase [Treponema sp.]